MNKSEFADRLNDMISISRRLQIQQENPEAEFMYKITSILMELRQGMNNGYFSLDYINEKLDQLKEHSKFLKSYYMAAPR